MELLSCAEPTTLDTLSFEAKLQTTEVSEKFSVYVQRRSRSTYIKRFHSASYQKNGPYKQSTIMENITKVLRDSCSLVWQLVLDNIFKDVEEIWCNRKMQRRRFDATERYRGVDFVRNDEVLEKMVTRR